MPENTIKNETQIPTGGKPRRPSIYIWLIFILISLLGFGPLVWLWIHTFLTKTSYSYISFALLSVFLLIIFVAFFVTYYKSYHLVPEHSQTHDYVQILILAIAIFSFYAFGWPKEIEIGELRNAFSELCVILTLFLLSELAAFLTVTSGQIQRGIASTGETITGQIKAGSDLVNNTFNHMTSQIHTDIESMVNKIKPEKVIEAVNRFQTYSNIEESLHGLNESTREIVIADMVIYTQRWKEFLKQQSENSEAFKASLAIFRNYIRTESSNLAKSTSAGGKAKYISLSTSQDFYLSLLTEVLYTLGSNQADKFVWAISDSLPTRWYSWGEKYGRPGALGVMEGFTKKVASLVNDGIEYHRTFLVKDPASSTQDIKGLNLEDGKSALQASTSVLMLVGETTDNETVDKSLPVSHWRKIFANQNYMKELGPNEKAYGIIESEEYNQLHDKGKLSELNNRKNVPVGYKYLCVRPVKLLEYFEKKYQSANGMTFLPISNSLELELPLCNTDWLILGTKLNNDYTPIVAVSALTTLSSETLRVEIFTAPEHLESIKKFWEQTASKRMDRETFLSMVRQSTDKEKQNIKDNQSE